MNQILKFLTLYSFFIVYLTIFFPRDIIPTLIVALILCFFGVGIIFFHSASIKKIFIKKSQIILLTAINLMICLMSYFLITPNNFQNDVFAIFFVIMNPLCISILGMANEMVYEKVIFYKNFDIEENKKTLDLLKSKIKIENNTEKLLELTRKFNKINSEIKSYNYYSKIDFYKEGL